MKNYVDIAKKMQKENAVLRQEAINRGSILPVENEFEEVIINNNLNRIKRFSKIKTLSKEMEKKNTQNDNVIQSKPASNILNTTNSNPTTQHQSNQSQMRTYNIEESSPVTLGGRGKENLMKVNNYAEVQSQGGYDKLSAAAGMKPSSPVSNINAQRFINNSNQIFINNNFHNMHIVSSNVNSRNNHFPPLQAHRGSKSAELFRMPIKRGMFSYPKTNFSLNNVNSRLFQLNTAFSNNILNQATLLGANSSSTLGLNNNSGGDIVRNISVEKYQINKPPRNNSFNGGMEESDSVFNNSSMRKNYSASSINFDKYKIANNPSTFSKITSNNDGSSANLLGNLSTPEVANLLKNELSSKKNIPNTGTENYGKVVMNNKVKDVTDPKDKYHTFASNNQYLLDNATSSASNSPNLERNSNNNNFMSVPLKSFMYRPNFSYYSSKPKHEKESRRMIVELVKVSLSSSNGVGGVINDLNVSPMILEREKIGSESISNKVNNDSATSTVKQNIKSEESNTVSPIPSSTNQLDKNCNESRSFDSHNSINSVNQFMFNMEENSPEKIQLLCFLAIPKIMKMHTGSANSSQYLFVVSPSNVCYTHGIENYIFQWREVNTFALVGGIDILKISSCSVKSHTGSTFVIETMRDKEKRTFETSRYEITAMTIEECNYYANALNFVSQLVKCKAYSIKGMRSEKK